MKNYMEFIEINPKIMFGKPVIKGTRITVEQILEDLGSGRKPSSLMKEYPILSNQHIHAAFRFAADALKGERIYPVAV